MQNIQAIFKNNFLEMFKFKRYKIFSVWFRIIIFILMSPFILLATLLGVFFQIQIFGFKIAQVIPRYIKETIDENEVSAAAQFVVYIVAYPIKFFFDFLIAFQMVFLAVFYFFFVSMVYLASFGGVKYQPYLMEADGLVEKEVPTYKFPKIAEIIISGVMVLITVTLFIVYIVSITIVPNNRRMNMIAPKVSEYLIDKGYDKSYEIKESIYYTDRFQRDFGIAHIKHNGIDYYIQVYEHLPTETITLFEYQNFKYLGTHDESFVINLKKLTRRVKKLTK